MQIAGRRVFYAPLDWGLGHASRSVSIIRDLLANNNAVLLGVTPLTQHLLTQEFPDLQKIPLPPYNIRYSRWLPLWFKLLSAWPRIQQVMQQEQRVLRHLVNAQHIDLVISDSRFGLFGGGCPSILVTHQVFVKAPFATGLAQWMNARLLRRFDELWIPDYAEESASLSGQLSHGKHYHPRVRYLGPQSRLEQMPPAQKKFAALFLLSGPEPQRELLAAALRRVARAHPQLPLAVAGQSGGGWPSNVLLAADPTAAELAQLLAASSRVVCRSGYSSLMDLHRMQIKNMVLVPTPGQSEQLYLARYWQEHFQAVVVSQTEVEMLQL